MTELLEDLLDILIRCSIAHMVVGSVSSSLYGQARTTQDLDVVVELDLAQLAHLITMLPESRYYLSPETAREAIRRRSQFNVIDLGTGGKVDLMVLKGRPFSQMEFQRRCPVELLGRTISVASVEDVILSKLEWNKITPSERQIRDVVGILSVQAEAVDRAYLQHWAQELGVAAKLNEILAVLE